MKSSFSGYQGNCIDVEDVNGVVVIRETDDPTRSIATTPEKFQAFIEGVKAGQFDIFGIPSEYK